MSVIWIDTRQKPKEWEWLENEFISKGYQIKKDKPMTYGDYCMPPNLSIIIDTKYCILEVVNNITSNSEEHKRFRNELIGCQEMGSKLYVLIIDEIVRKIEDLIYWVNPRLKYYNVKKNRALRKGEEFKQKPPTSGIQVAKAMRTMEEKYGVTFLFCKKNECCDKILNLLERKEEY